MNEQPNSHHVDSGPLERPVDGRLIGGVAAGFARFFSVDVVLVRAIFVVLSFFSGIGVALYLAAWALIGETGSKNSVSGEVLIRSWCK
jgi:phage shock protein PspC (stress-responsive transcriptional regulator)